MKIYKKQSNSEGFLVIEILISGMILTASIAATMYLFRIGYSSLELAEESNIVSSKLPQAIGLLRNHEFDKKSKGNEEIGDNVSLEWEAKLINSTVPTILMRKDEFGNDENPSIHDIFLYKVRFSLTYRTLKRDYEINVFRSKQKEGVLKDMPLL